MDLVLIIADWEYVLSWSKAAVRCNDADMTWWAVAWAALSQHQVIHILCVSICMTACSDISCMILIAGVTILRQKLQQSLAFVSSQILNGMRSIAYSIGLFWQSEKDILNGKHSVARPLCACMTCLVSRDCSSQSLGWPSFLDVNCFLDCT